MKGLGGYGKPSKSKINLCEKESREEKRGEEEKESEGRA